MSDTDRSKLSEVRLRSKILLISLRILYEEKFAICLVHFSTLSLNFSFFVLKYFL